MLEYEYDKTKEIAQEADEMMGEIKLEVGRMYIVERRSKLPNGETTTKKFVTKIDWIDQRDGFLYVGHTPVDFRNGRFGAFRFYEGRQKPFGMKVICIA